jgi:hypothetical protein
MFVKTGMDTPIAELVNRTAHTIVAIWAADCAERVLPNFREKYPDDTRPGEAIDAVREWARTGVFRMADVRKISRAAHAAAREVEGDAAARSAAVPPDRRWQQPTFLPMLSLLLSTLQPLSGMLPTPLMPVLPRPENVTGNITTYSV